MKLDELAGKIGAEIVSTGNGGQVQRVYAGDRVSDILNHATDGTLLVSNLSAAQLLRVAELMDVPGVCLVNGHRPAPEAISTAQANGVALLVSPADLFETCGRLYQSLTETKRS